MKISRTGSDKFKPFTLNIRVETKEEAQALYAIFDLRGNTRLFDTTTTRAIRSSIGEENYVCKSDSVISRGIRYCEFYK